MAYTDRMPPSLSIVIPVLNEEEEIVRILTGARAMLEERGGDWEILVVDNASTDRTGERVAAVPGRLPDPAPAQRGQPGQGLLHPPGDARGHRRPPAHVRRRLRHLARVHSPHLEEALDEVDVAVGSRLSAGARVDASTTDPTTDRRVRLPGPHPDHDGPAARATSTAGSSSGAARWPRPCSTRVHLDGWAFDAEALAMARRLGTASARWGSSGPTGPTRGSPSATSCSRSPASCGRPAAMSAARWPRSVRAAGRGRRPADGDRQAGRHRRLIRPARTAVSDTRPGTTAGTGTRVGGGRHLGPVAQLDQEGQEPGRQHQTGVGAEVDAVVAAHVDPVDVLLVAPRPA